MNIAYRIARTSDIEAITDLSCLLYCGDYSDRHEYDELFESNKDDLLNPKMAFFITFDGDKPVGFAHVSLRFDYVNGTNSDVKGFLEGIYIRDEYRKCGIARTLNGMCEDWAKSKSCVEFASDCLLENTEGLAFHLKIGLKKRKGLFALRKIWSD